MSDHTAPPAPLDGSSGNLLARTEPKVKAAALVAFLTPLALYYVYRYVPGVSSLPHELDALVGTLVTGLLTFAAGYAARAVDRVDLFTQPLLEKAGRAVNGAVGHVVGVSEADDLESWARQIGGKVVHPLEQAAQAVAGAAEVAAVAGADPLAAARAAIPAARTEVLDAVQSAGAAVAADLAPVAAQALADAPVLVPAVAVQAQGSPAAAADELRAELQKLLARLDGSSGTPIADAVAAVSAPVSAPATAEIPVVSTAGVRPAVPGPVTEPLPAVDVPDPVAAGRAEVPVASSITVSAPTAG